MGEPEKVGTWRKWKKKIEEDERRRFRKNYLETKRSEKRYMEGCLTRGNSSWNSRISGLCKKNALFPFTKVCSHFPIVALFLFSFLIFFDKSVFGSCALICVIFQRYIFIHARAETRKWGLFLELFAHAVVAKASVGMHYCAASTTLLKPNTKSFALRSFEVSWSSLGKHDSSKRSVTD